MAFSHFVFLRFRFGEAIGLMQALTDFVTDFPRALPLFDGDGLVPVHILTDQGDDPFGKQLVRLGLDR